MRVYARFRLPDGTTKELRPGEVIGRGAAAALRISDPRISEAHALLSLRGATLRILALRGRFTIEGRPTTDVEVEPGLRVVLASAVALECEEVVLPEAVLGVTGPGLAATILGPVTSLRDGGAVVVMEGGFAADAELLVWSDADGFAARSAEGERRISVGETLVVGRHQVTAVMVPIAALGHADTNGQSLGVALHITARYDTVHIDVADGRRVVLDGLLARIVSELVVLRVPIGWDALAKELWPDETEPTSLRQKWDQSLVRIRRKLREANVRADLVRSNRAGQVELYLGPLDRVDDQT